MKEKIKEYFSTGELKVLDGSSKLYYTGVTVGYIAKYVTKEHISETAKVLLEMHDNKEIKALYCNYVKNIVFENMEARTHWNYQKESPEWNKFGHNQIYYRYFYDKMQKLINKDKSDSKKMTQEELQKDLLGKLNTRGYFKDKLFEDDTEIFGRRSFGDLFKYYSKYGVTEKELLKALIATKIGSKICRQAKKVVFCKYSTYAPNENYFTSEYSPSDGYAAWLDKSVIDKYTPSYLNSLLEK